LKSVGSVGVRKSLEEIHSIIFAPDMASSKHATLMIKTDSSRNILTSRYKFVNFENQVGNSGKNLSTLEFRQHFGTLSSEEVKQWGVVLDPTNEDRRGSGSGTKGSYAFKTQEYSRDHSENQSKPTGCADAAAKA
jgi:hypothetical protein